MARFRNVVFTWNNPTGLIDFDEELMDYLVYQEEVGATGTYHFQGYVEFKTQQRMKAIKDVLGGATTHIERRRGTAAEAIAYATKDDTRVDGPYEFGEPKIQGKRNDLESFKNAVLAGAKQRDLVDEYWGVMARYWKFYHNLAFLTIPVRTTDLVVTLHYGETGLGKTRAVYDECGADPLFYRTPLSNNTIWFDGYDGHTKVLLDDFSGASSHLPLCTLLQLLDRYPLSVPTKGGHTWWMPDALHVTTNILPRDWYKWDNRAEQYKALARRFHKVYLYYVPLSDTDCGRIEQDPMWWQENKPEQVLY